MKPICIISCPIDTFSGYGARSRDFVKALIQLKDKEWDIKILPQKWGECPWNYLSKDDPLRQRFIGNVNQQPDIWFQITIPSEFQAIGKFSVGVTAGIETNVFPGDFIEGMNRMDLNLVSSEHSKVVALSTQFDKIDNNTKQKLGTVTCTKPVEVLFEGLDLNKYYKKPPTCIDIKTSNILKGVTEDFCFLFTGHWLPGSFGEDRKNVGLLIDTFIKTFKGLRKKPALVLKVNKVNYSLLDKEGIIKKINDIRNKYEGQLPNIYLIHGELTDKEMNLLNNDPKIKSFVINSTVPLEPIALSLYILNTSLPFVTVRVIVSALALSSDTRIDDTNVVIKEGHVYKVVTFVVVKSNFTFLYLDVLRTLAIYFFLVLPVISFM